MATLSDAQRKKLRKVYLSKATPEQRESLLDQEKNLSQKEFNKHLETIANGNTQTGMQMDIIREGIKGLPTVAHLEGIKTEIAAVKSDTRKSVNVAVGASNDRVAELQEAIVKSLEELKGIFSVKNSTPMFSDDESGFFKDGPTMLAQIGTNTSQTADLIRNLKWNASQQLRDVNGSPINPSIAPFAITQTYDDVKLTNYDGSGNVGTITYYQNGNIRAQLTLTYDGSGNLTDVTRNL